jgi:hypothetical protein
MAMGVLSGFNVTRLTTTAATTVTSGPSYVAARLSGTAACKLRIYNGSTAAADQVAVLSVAAANGVDELSVPLRCNGGVRVIMSVNTATAFIYTR